MSDREIVDNPFADVDFAAIGHYKDEMHAHIDEGGKVTGPPQNVIDEYSGWATDILCVNTPGGDHVAYPWTDLAEIGQQHYDRDDWEDRDPDALDMIQIPGSEQWIDDEYGHHIHGFCGETDIPDYVAPTFIEFVENVAADGGFVTIAHPARYRKPFADEDQYTVEDYIPGFDAHPVEDYPGLVVYNKNSPQWAKTGKMNYENRHDEHLWDDLLTHFAPDRNVFGFAEDDPHHLDFTRGGDADVMFNLLLLEENEFTEAGVEQAYRDGRFYPVERWFWNGELQEVHYPTADPRPYPVIEDVSVDDEQGTITVTATDTDRISWISNGVVVGTGATLDYQTNVLGNYVRAALYTDDDRGRLVSRASTQPIMIKGNSSTVMQMTDTDDVRVLRGIDTTNDKTSLDEDGNLGVEGNLDTTESETNMTSDGDLNVGGSYSGGGLDE